jgi:hypothetical protein
MKNIEVLFKAMTRQSIYMVILFGFILAIFTSSVSALQFSLGYTDDGPRGQKITEITMRGEIVSGDASQLRSILINLPQNKQPISFVLDSPGGNLMEAIEIAKVISQIESFTKATVGTEKAETEICASACLFAYLGADFRYLGSNGRIGIHQFNELNSDMTASDGISLAQEVSSELLRILEVREVDPALLQRMGKTKIENIDWVPDHLLREWKVVTGDVVKEISEIRNVDGRLSLVRKQLSIHGQNGITFTCHNDMLLVNVFFDGPGFRGIGQMLLIIDGIEYNVEDFRRMKDVEGLTPVSFFVPAELLSNTAKAKDLGARIISHSGKESYTYNQLVLDNELNDLVIECIPELKEQTEQSGIIDIWSTMILHENTDFIGNDLTEDGFRDVTFSECQEMCSQYVQCKAVSYVIMQKLCWMKSSAKSSRKAIGVVSATK